LNQQKEGQLTPLFFCLFIKAPSNASAAFSSAAESPPQAVADICMVQGAPRDLRQVDPRHEIVVRIGYAIRANRRFVILAIILSQLIRR
jgi:hypothetical protein